MGMFDSVGYQMAPAFAPVTYDDGTTYDAPKMPRDVDMFIAGERSARRRAAAAAAQQPRLQPRPPNIPNSQPEARPPVRMEKRLPWAGAAEANPTPRYNPGSGIRNRLPSPSAYQPAPTTTANNPFRLGIPRIPGTGQGAVKAPRVPTRTAPKPPMSIPGPRGGIATGAGVSGAVSGVVTTAAILASGGNLGDAVAIGAGTAIGAVGGSLVGAALGSALGPIGTYVGAELGGALGAAAGSAVGGLVANMFFDDLPSGAIAGGLNNNPGITYGPPPFTGGQSPDALYDVAFYRARIGFPESIDVYSLYGPIVTAYAQYTSTTPPNFVVKHVVVGAAAPFEAPRTFEFGPILTADLNSTLIGVTRNDGQPDTGGDPQGPEIEVPESQPRNAAAAGEGRSVNQVGNGSPSPLPAPLAMPTPPNLPGLRPPPPSDEARPSILPENTPEDGEVSPENAPSPVPAPQGAPLAIGTGSKQANLPGLVPASAEQVNPDASDQPLSQWTVDPDGNVVQSGTSSTQVGDPNKKPNAVWEITTKDGQKIQLKQNPDGTIDWAEKLPVLGAAAAAGLAGIAASSGALKPLPKTGTAPLGTALGSTEKITSAPQNAINQPPEPPRQPNPTTNPCGCNAPILGGLNDLGKKVDLVNAGMGGASLAALLAELTKIGNAVGVSAFPASVPANLAKPGAGNKSLGNLAEMGAWQVEQLDGLVGQFPQTTNVVLPNGSTVEMQQPNIAESLAEIQGMLFGQAITTGEVLHTASRTLQQAGSATQQAHMAHLYGKANAEFLGYEGASPSVDIPMAYSPGKEPFEGLLGESIQKIRGWENRDGQDLKAILAELLQAAHIIQAVHWKKLDGAGNFKAQIQNDLRAQSAYLDGEADRKKGSNDWEQYLEQVEQGFAARSGDSTPYGRPSTEAPRIRDLSDPDAGSQEG